MKASKEMLLTIAVGFHACTCLPSPFQQIAWTSGKEADPGRGLRRARWPGGSLGCPGPSGRRRTGRCGRRGSRCGERDCVRVGSRGEEPRLRLPPAIPRTFLAFSVPHEVLQMSSDVPCVFRQVRLSVSKPLEMWTWQGDQTFNTAFQTCNEVWSRPESACSKKSKGDFCADLRKVLPSVFYSVRSVCSCSFLLAPVSISILAIDVQFSSHR